MTPSLIYLCGAIDEATCAARNITTDSPAATRKVFQIASAMREAGTRVVVLSLGRGAQRGTGKWHRASARMVSGVPVVYAIFFDFPVLTHFVSLLSVAVLTWRLRHRAAARAVLIYNYLPHYLLALSLARWSGLRCYLDIEDGVTQGDRSLRGTVGRNLRKSLNCLCRDGALLATKALAPQYDGARTICCYGTAETVAATRSWAAPRLKVLIGGTLIRDTGSDLLAEAIRGMRETADPAFEALEFVVTGRGDGAQTLAALASASAVPRLTFCGSVKRAEYDRILGESHIGLCLKLPSSEIGNTTFPSKVIEITSSGLLLLSTRVSDVPILFDDTEAVFLDAEDPRQLAERLVAIVRNRAASEAIARMGQAKAATICGKTAVGRALHAFFALGGDDAQPKRQPR